MQHGRASGVDSYVSLHGGCVRFQGGEAQKVPLPRVPVFIVHTGVPETTTGECVSRVAREFEKSMIWDDFEEITRRVEQVLGRNDIGAIQAAIRENHRLLVRIGVVPERVQQFVADIERWGGSAKISGAGAIAGDKGGVVMVIAEKPPVELCTRYGYELVAVRGEPLGVRIVGD